MQCHVRTMTKPPESVHDRLNRELYRHYFGGWKVWLAVLALLLCFGWLLYPQPLTVTYQTGVVTGVTTLQGEGGPIIRIGVQTGDIRVEAGTGAKFVAPANGETTCLRRTIGDWTGMEAFSLAPIRRCDAR